MLGYCSRRKQHGPQRFSFFSVVFITGFCLKNMTSMRSSTVDDFNLPGVFRTLSQENATQAIELARSFEREAPRATALIAVARTLLSEKAK
jgi:hypothetical protein